MTHRWDPNEYYHIQSGIGSNHKDGVLLSFRAPQPDALVSYPGLSSPFARDNQHILSPAERAFYSFVVIKFLFCYLFIHSLVKEISSVSKFIPTFMFHTLLLFFIELFIYIVNIHRHKHFHSIVSNCFHLICLLLFYASIYFHWNNLHVPFNFLKSLQTVCYRRTRYERVKQRKRLQTETREIVRLRETSWSYESRIKKLIQTVTIRETTVFLLSFFLSLISFNIFLQVSHLVHSSFIKDSLNIKFSCPLLYLVIHTARPWQVS